MTTRKICPECGDQYGPEQEVCPRDGSPLRVESIPDPLIGRIVADRYHVTGLIGEGGMGRVYVAEHVRMGRKSALKVMSPALAATPDAITRFNREASNASRINHPNVAAIYDFGETTDGLLYIAMEYVEGETLHSLVERDGPIPIARATQIAKGAADALHAAHHLGIVHRDLKPDNIMLARQLDGSDWVKVVDFGIAKSVAAGERPGGGGGGQTVTTAGVSLGTPEYMSPEQLAGEKLDPRTDIYSLGLVLFNMLTGVLPYPRLTSKETLVRRLTSPPATLADVRPDVAWPQALQAVLTRALDPEPDRRYAGVEDFGRALAAVGTAVSAGAPAGTEADPDRTVRISPAARPAAALGATAVQRPPAGAGKTRRLPPDKPRRSWAMPAAVLILLMAVAGFAVAHRPGNTPPAGPPANSAADSARDPSTAKAPGGAESSSAGRVAQGDSAAVPDRTTTPPAAPPVTPVPRRAASMAVSPARNVAPSSPLPAPADSAPVPPDGSPRTAQIAPPGATPSTDSAVGRRGAGARSGGGALRNALTQIGNQLDQAGRLVAEGRMLQANTAMQSARQQIRTLRSRIPPGQVPPPLDRELRAMAMRALQSCFSAAQGNPQAAQRCRQLQQREARAGLGRMPGRVRP